MTVRVPYIEVTQHGNTFLLTKLPARVLARISYASVRGRDTEAGAVQRFLSSTRISAIREFTINNGNYPSAIVLNWVSTTSLLIKADGFLTLPDDERVAQLIDGQHRVAGIKSAIESDANVGNLEIPVAIYEGLNTQQCANIFLAINTEQKPVPRSLVFDLYGVVDESIIDPAIVRARDIVTALNENEASPYYELIKFPGSPRKRGGVALSTAMTAIKPSVEEKGDFEQVGVNELEMQQQILLNYFSAIKDCYGDNWDTSSNAFMYASGFVGALDFFRKKLIPYCITRGSFEKTTFLEVLPIDPGNLILQEEVKSINGKDAPKVIFERLNGVFAPNMTTNQTFRV